MKFRLRRHAAAPAPVAAVAPAPAMSQDQLFAIVHQKMAEFIGAEGTWVVTRRSAGDGDPIFHDMLARSIAHELAMAIHLDGVRNAPVGAAAAAPTAAAETAPALTASVVGTPAMAPLIAQPAATISAQPVSEPAALGWNPEPIAVWADVVKTDAATSAPAARADATATGSTPVVAAPPSWARTERTSA